MLLSRRWALHDIADVEAFCSRVLDKSPASSVPSHEREDVLAELIAKAWELSDEFDPDRAARFSTFAHRRLRFFLVDRSRRKYRTRWVSRRYVYERPRPEILSLDADGAGDGGLGAAVTGGGLDHGEHRFPDELRALSARSRRPGGRDNGVGEEAA